MSRQYFQSTKRGEISELREELNSASRDKQRDVRSYCSILHSLRVCRL